jgi:hypothetical protein
MNRFNAENMNMNNNQNMEDEIMNETKDMLVEFCQLDGNSVWQNNDFLDRMNSDEQFNCHIHGNVQSGKTHTQIKIAAYNAILKNKTTVMVIRNMVSDKLQLERSIQYMLNNNNGKLKTHLYDNYDIEFDSINVLYVGKARDSNAITQSLQRRNNNDEMNANIIVCLANTTQINKLTSIINNQNNNGNQCHFDLIVDEVDEITSDDGRVGIPQREILYHNLTTLAYNVFGVTATSFNNFFTNRLPVSGRNVFVLDNSENYIGIHGCERNIDLVPFENSPMTFFDNQNDEFITDIDPTLVPFLHAMSSIKTSMNDRYKIYQRGPYQRHHHPVIALINNTVGVNNHWEIVNHFTRHVYTDGDDNNINWVGISYDGKGIVMYYPWSNTNQFTPLDIPCALSRNHVSSVSCTSNPRMHQFKNLEIGDVLTWLKSMQCNRRNSIPITHVAIVSCLLASRGVSFCSNNYEQKERWHLTHMYYKPSLTKDCVANIQSMRVCGVFKDNIVPVVYLPGIVRQNILKAITLQNLFLHTIQTNPELNTKDILRELVGDIPDPMLPTNKISKKVNIDG